MGVAVAVRRCFIHFRCHRRCDSVGNSELRAPPLCGRAPVPDLPQTHSRPPQPSVSLSDSRVFESTLPVSRPSGCAAAMALQRLAVVELQLVMHCCDLKSLLALACCSRWTLVAASDPFAWRALCRLPVPLVFPSHSSDPIADAWQWLFPPPVATRPCGRRAIGATRTAAALLRRRNRLALRW